MGRASELQVLWLWYVVLEDLHKGRLSGLNLVRPARAEVEMNGRPGGEEAKRSPKRGGEGGTV